MSEPYDVTRDYDRAIGLRRLVDRAGREWLEVDPCGSATGAPDPSRLDASQIDDLLMAYLAGEMSEGFLREMLHATTGLDGDQVRALWFDAVERGRRLADAWSSTRNSGGAGDTPGRPGSSEC